MNQKFCYLYLEKKLVHKNFQEEQSVLLENFDLIYLLKSKKWNLLFYKLIIIQQSTSASSLMQITDPDKFEMATVLTKNSKTGITSNKRLLVIKKGYLYYYSKVPKTFRGDPKTLQSFHELPKCSIQILNIKKINGYENNSSYFSIEFEAKHMMERDDIRKTMMLEEFNFAPKNTKQTITWQFTCDNQFVKQRWVAALKALITHYGKEKINIQKFFDGINSKKQEKNSMPVRSSTRVPWRQDQMKNSGSNENLHRTSYVNTMIQNNRFSSQNKKSSSRSDQISFSKHQSDIEFKKKITTTQNIVEAFIEEEKQKQQNKEDNLKQEVETPAKPGIQQQKQVKQIKSEREYKSSEENKKEEKQIEVKQERKDQQNEQLDGKEELVFKKTLSNVESDYDSPRSSDRVYKLSQIKAMTPESPQNTKYKEQVHFQSFQHSYPLPPPTLPIKQEQQINVKMIESLEIRTQPLPPIIPKQPKKLKSLLTKNQPLNKYSLNKIQFDLSEQQTFYDMFYFSVCREYSFHKRMQAQKRFNALIGSFVQKAQEQFCEFINSKNTSQAMRYREVKISERMAFVQVGYLKFQIAYASTQGVIINNRKKIYYDEEAIKNMKKCMKAYNRIFNHIVDVHKNASTTVSESDKLTQMAMSLRVPRCTFMEYRGVSCMAYEDEHSQKHEKVITNAAEIKLLGLIFEKLGLNSTCFQFKSCSKSNSEVRIPYIITPKNIFIEVKKIPKHHNVTFRSPMNIDFIRNAKKQNASTSLESLSKYLKGIKKINNPDIFTCPKQQIQRILEYMYICKYIRKFYRAAQGEIDEKNFLNLIFKDDQNMIKMFEIAGYEYELMSQQKNKPFLGIFFDFLEYYTGISCLYDHQAIKKANLSPLNICSQKKMDFIHEVKIKPKIICYTLEQLELYESFAKMDRYLLNHDIQAAVKVLEIKESVFFENPYQERCYPWAPNLQCIMNSAEINFIENDYISSIKQCKHFIQFFNQSIFSEDEQEVHEIDSMRHIPHITIPAYMLLLKCYSKFSSEQFTLVLKKISDLIIFNYGEESSLLVVLFTFVAGGFCSMGETEKANRLILAAIEIGQKIYNRQNLLDLYLDGSRLYKNQNELQQANKMLSSAKKLIQKQEGGKFEKMELKVLIFQLELLLVFPKSITNEEKVLALINKIEGKIKVDEMESHFLRELYKIYYDQGCKYNRVDIINNSLEKLWSLCLDSPAQILSLQLAYTYILHKNIDRFEGIHSEAQSIRHKNSLNKEKALMYLSDSRVQNEHTLMQLIQQGMLQQNLQLLGAIYSLILNSNFMKNFPIQN